MQEYLKLLEFKLKSAEYHYDQALSIADHITKDNVHICLTEFTAMVNVLSNCLEIAHKCAFKQSAVEVKAYDKALTEQQKDDRFYLHQFLEAERTEHVFDISEDLYIKIKPIKKRRSTQFYPERDFFPSISEMKTLAEYHIKELMKIYTKSSDNYDQSWRKIELQRTSFSCSTCGSLVTDILSHIGNLSEVKLKDKEDLLPRFNYVYGHEIIRADLLPWGGVNEIGGREVLVPTSNLYFGTTKEPAPGCCGPDSSTYNVLCRNGHPVGKEAGDCWMPHFVRLPLDRVKRSS